jgi:hypothetical protein
MTQTRIPARGSQKAPAQAAAWPPRLESPPPPRLEPVPPPRLSAARPPRLEPAGSFRLTGPGAILALFGFCFAIMLIAAWTGWGAPAGAAFVCGCGVITYYTRASGLRAVVVCPPPLFLAGTVGAELITAPSTFLAAEETLVTLGTLAAWLFTGTALTIVIAFGRGYRPVKPGTSRLPWMNRLSGPPGGPRDGSGPRGQARP